MSLVTEGTKPPGLWNLVVLDNAEDAEIAPNALAKVCRTYWLPVYAFFRGKKAEPEDARDLTESFLRHVLSRETIEIDNPACARLRLFFFSTATHQLTKFHTDPNAPQADGPEIPFLLDFREAEHRFLIHGSDLITTERLYDRLWALQTFDKTSEELQTDYTRQEGEGRYEIFARFLPKRIMNRSAYKQEAKELGVTEERFLEIVDDLRSRFRTMLNRNVADTVLERELISNEVHTLYWSLRR